MDISMLHYEIFKSILGMINLIKGKSMPEIEEKISGIVRILFDGYNYHLPKDITKELVNIDLNTFKILESNSVFTKNNLVSIVIQGLKNSKYEFVDYILSSKNITDFNDIFKILINQDDLERIEYILSNYEGEIIHNPDEMIPYFINKNRSDLIKVMLDYNQIKSSDLHILIKCVNSYGSVKMKNIIAMHPYVKKYIDSQ